LQLVLPFMLMGAVASVVYHAIAVDTDHLLHYGLIIAGIGILRSLYGVIRTGDVGFLLFALYGFLHVAFLIPTRLYALATMSKSHWGSRTPPSPPPPSHAKRFQFVGATLLLSLAIVGSMLALAGHLDGTQSQASERSPLEMVRR
jgi:hypothetical protein